MYKKIITLAIVNLVSTAIFTASLAVSEATETLVVEGMVRGGEKSIVVINFDQDSVTKKVIISGSWQFHCNSSGQFVYQDYGTRKWYRGSISDTQSKTPLTGMPENARGVAISHGGDKVSWVLNENFKDKLIVASFEDKKLRCEFYNKNGLVMHPSWAPDDSSIAFYKGTKPTLNGDGIVVALATCVDGDLKIENITPPSRPLGSELRGLLPRWSPKGDKLLIQGAFNKNDDSGICVVNIFEKYMYQTKWGYWLPDNEHLIALEKISPINEKNHIVTYHPDLKNIEFFDVLVPDNCTKIQPNTKCDMVACYTSDRKIYIVDVNKKNLFFLIDLYYLNKFYWIE